MLIEAARNIAEWRWKLKWLLHSRGGKYPRKSVGRSWVACYCDDSGKE